MEGLFPDGNLPPGGAGEGVELHHHGHLGYRIHEKERSVVRGQEGKVWRAVSPTPGELLVKLSNMADWASAA